MTDPFVKSCVEELKDRALTDGGFRSTVKGHYGPDSTAWAIIALNAVGWDGYLIDLARSRIAGDQHEDGRISVSPSHPEAFWPTPLAVLAWENSPFHKKAQLRAIDFLIGTSGAYWPKDPKAAYVHDTSLRGWSWIERTHSWVDPTSLSVQALKLTGHENHHRVTEAVRLLLDRQLPNGGWNCGNTIVFGKELWPLPDSTGIALDALSGTVPLQTVQSSLNYLKMRIIKVRSPLSLGWGLLGLGAWGEKPTQAKEWLVECRQLQERYGSYNTSLVSLILLAYLAPSGLLSLITKQDR
ncbi:MAG: prenyltransferase/squalene oxidase repeat-containing protein [Pseudomonadota bacterium]